MNITVSPELKAYIDPLTLDEHAALERSLLAEGCRDALVLWGDVLVDGHNRYGICQKHGLPFQTVQNTRFQSMEDVYLWMIDQHLGRRSVSDFQRGVLALRKREILAERRGQAASAESSELPDGEATQSLPADQSAAKPLHSREDIAKAARLSSSQVVQIEKIQKQAAPELVEALKAGAVSLNAAAAVASLPEEEQRAAVIAGKDELKQAAKRVREARRRPAEASAGTEDTAEGPDGARSASVDELSSLRGQVAALQAENASLREQVAALRERLGEPAARSTG
ncbi:plasmid replication/partition related protein [Hydrogenophaga crassostreae]|uniref:Plasmid replication/partition related protein n=1 Tax=Hydrogenophaga crassostreae TaxID=1763535 RepID=A0A167H724_9BURK|nr:plasmid replication/partition related protein [Hydrogenophaga crassostreae]AOW12543.1 plasmid replication/partition related protein [Hydrogenophaga crassostreae]OAD40412.1 plasmid replication/partition related protein [Hydrogenophaga crassostreae]